MNEIIGIGYQDFARIRQKNIFYVDKTRFIREWWEGRDEVTLIARPRRFGKTLNMSMLENFFLFSMQVLGSCFAISQYGRMKHTEGFKGLTRLCLLVSRM